MVKEVAILIRHISNIVLFQFARKHQGISGQVRYETWLTYSRSAAELISFALLFLVVYLFTGSISFLGGAALTALTGLEHLKLSGKAKDDKRENG